MNIYRYKNLIVSLLCIILLTGCFHVSEPVKKTNWRIYVWDFVSRHKKMIS